MTRRAQTGRAELLRALAQGVEAPLALDATETVWFGFRSIPVVLHSFGPISDRVVLEVGSDGWIPSEVENVSQPPLQMDTIWAVVEHSEIPGDETPTNPIPQVEPITEEEAKAPSPVRQFEFEDLVPWARLTPVLRQRLAKSHRAGVDMAALCRAVARQQPLRHHLPQHTRTRWHPDLVVALDFSPRLWPYRWDMHRLCAQLRRQCGRHGVSLRILSNGPWGQWTGWRGDAGPDDAAEFEARDWVMPAAGSRLLIAGDLGRLSPGGAMEPAWRGFVEDALAAGVQVEALVPLGAGQVSAEWAARLPVIRWSQDGALRPEQGETLADDAHDPDFHALMAMVAGLRRVDPPLLRALRRLLPGQHGNAGFEGAVWSHADVRAGMACEVAPEAAAGWLDHYRERLAPELQREHQTLRRLHHGHLRAALNHEEVLLHAAHAGGDAGAVSAEEVDVSEQFLARVARWVGDTGGYAAPAAWQTFASEAVRCADPRTAQRFAGVYTDLLAADLRRRGVTRLEGEDLPAWVEASRLLGRLGQGTGAVRRYWLVEDMRRRCIQLQPEPPGRLQRRLTAPIDAVRVVVGDADEKAGRRLVVLDGEVVPLCGADCRRAFVLRTDGLRLLFGPVRRPAWVEGWALDQSTNGPTLMLSDGSVLPPDTVVLAPPDASDSDRRFRLLLVDGSGLTLQQAMQVLDWTKRIFGDDHLDTTTAMGSLASILQERGDLEGARHYAEQVLDTRRRILGEDHSGTLTALNNLCTIIHAQGDFEGARLYAQQVFDTSRRVLGEDHPDTLTALNNLGQILQAQGDLVGARRYAEQVLDLIRRVLGEDHPNTLSALSNLGTILQAQGDMVDARRYGELVLDTSLRVLGDSHPNTLTALNNLGQILQTQGDLVGARNCAEKVLDSIRRVLGEDHLNTLTAMNNLGTILKAQGDLAGALRYAEQVLDMRRRLLGERHPDTTGAAWNVFYLLHTMREFNAAQSLLASDLAWLLNQDPEQLGADQRRIVKMVRKLMGDGRTI